MSDQIQEREAVVRPTLQDSQKKSAKQLLYRPAPVGQATKPIIRSSKTAALLQLGQIDDASSSCVGLGQPGSRRRTIQPGGFIRSRMTAELLGIEPGAPVS